MRLTGILCALAMLAAMPASAATTIKIATVAPDGTAWMRELRAAAEGVKKRTDGRVEIKYCPGGVMGDDATVLRKIKIGQLQGGAFTGGSFSLFAKDAQIYSLPFMFRSQEEIDQVRAKLDPLLKQSIAQAGWESLGISGSGFAYLMSTHAIRSRDDLRAAKVWVPLGDPVDELAFKAAGVTPIPLALADVYTSLQTGLIDTAANTPSGAIAFQWHTKIKHFVDVPLTYVVGIVVVEKKIYDGIDAEDRRALSEELTAASARLDKLSRDDNAGAREALERQGITVFTPGADDRKAWEAVGTEAYRQVVANNLLTPPLRKALEAALAEVRGKAAR
ncbi:TRAP transporter substrate-binding protein DctP [Dokdonella soli]|uniref:TRAP transporter substrate-binding protein n=1 Tax=Dokdonella soli TaxID=529810 RepID=A0ABN1IDG7_9GAMM